MTTVVLDPPPVELQALIERRKRLDQDRHDEIWEGVYHMAPAPRNVHTGIQQQLAVLLDTQARQAGLQPMIAGELNIGEPENFRVPDGALLRERRDVIWNPTAALVIEIVSPGDESWDKLPFYAAHRVDELLIVDPATRSIDWLGLSAGEGEDAGEVWVEAGAGAGAEVGADVEVGAEAGVEAGVEAEAEAEAGAGEKGGGEGAYHPIERSALIELGVSDLAERIDWPPTE